MTPEFFHTLEDNDFRTREQIKLEWGAIGPEYIHKDLMQYKTYCYQSLLIGSGSFGVAYRSIIQQRIKRSGQKCLEEGAQAIANLRCYRAGKAVGSVKKAYALLKAAICYAH